MGNDVPVLGAWLGAGAGIGVPGALEKVVPEVSALGATEGVVMATELALG